MLPLCVLRAPCVCTLQMFLRALNFDSQNMLVTTAKVALLRFVVVEEANRSLSVDRQLELPI